MFQLQTQLNLTELNTLNLPCVASSFISMSNTQDLLNVFDKFSLTSQNCFVLGGGSNVILPSKLERFILTFETKVAKDATVINARDQDTILIEVEAGVNWDDFVKYSVQQAFSGLENLSLIPGSVGAAPIQNIGAYGVELSNVIEEVSWYEFATQTLHKFSKAQCQFDYRDSIFKQQLKDKGIITQVRLKLPKTWQANVSYQGLDTLELNATAKEVYQRVIEIRQAKLPDPKIKPNAGSFFKNPVVDQEIYQLLVQQYPNMPAYIQTNNQVKLAAGWLIEQVGFKGISTNGVGVHDKQALVLVNHGQGTGIAIYQLALEINRKVFEKFGVYLQPEVRIVSTNGFIGNGDFNG